MDRLISIGLLVVLTGLTHAPPAVAQIPRIARHYAPAEGSTGYQAVAFSPDGSKYAAARVGSGGQAEVRIHRSDTHVELRRLVVDRPSEIYHLAFGGGDRLLCGGRGGVSLWNSRTGRKEASHVNDAIASGSSFAVSADGSAYVADNRVYSAKTGAVRVVIDGNVTWAAFSPDGRRIASADRIEDGPATVSIIHARTGRSLGVSLPEGFAAPSGIRGLIYAPDGSGILTINSGGRLVRYYSRHGDWLWSGNGDDTGRSTLIAATPDSHKVVSAATDNRIRIWDAATGILMMGIRCPAPKVVGLAASNSAFGAVSSDGSLTIWDMTGLETETQRTRKKIREEIAGVRGDAPAALAWLEEHGARLRLGANGSPVRISLARTYHSSSDVTDDWLDILADFPNLKQLWLHNARITDKGLHRLEAAPDLEELSLSGTKTSDDGLLQLTPFKKLRVLDLYGTKVTDVGLKVLAANHDLQDLVLTGTAVSDAGLRHLDALDLQRISLCSTAISDEGVRILSKHKTLEHLALPRTITDEGMKHVGTLPDLKGLTAGGRLITDAALVSVARLRELTSLSIGQTNLTFEVEAIEELQQLRYLDLEGSAVTDGGLCHVGKLKSLKTLILIETSITDEGLKHLTGLKKLKTLYLRATMVTPRGVEELRRALPNCDINVRWIG